MSLEYWGVGVREKRLGRRREGVKRAMEMGGGMK